MILEVLSRPNVRRPLWKALEGLSLRRKNSGAGEERLLLSGITWEKYEEIDEALGPDRPNPRLYYLDGEIEVMSTSLKHEELKKWLADLLGDYFYETGLEVFPHGQATMKLLREAGAEPDESWCFGEQKQWPEVVLEIALTSGGIDKLEIYRRFGVAEVWFWHKGTLELWTLSRDGARYEGPGKRSRLMPGLDVVLLTRCLASPTWREARRALRAALRGHKG